MRKRNWRPAQEELCRRFGVPFVEAVRSDVAGASRNVGAGLFPVHGLRHPTSSGTSGWYLWAGEYSSDAGFFEPIHVAHLDAIVPAVMPYLGLPPGWRFLIAPGHEDVWEDAGLLDV